MLRGKIPAHKLGDQRGVLLRLLWVEDIGTIALSHKRYARPHRDHGMPGGVEAGRQLIAQTAFVHKEQPAASHLRGRDNGMRSRNPLPTRRIEPVAHRLLFDDTRWGAVGLRYRGRVDPVALALKGIGRQREALTPLVGIESGPVNRTASQPDLPEGRLQCGAISLGRVSLR